MAANERASKSVGDSCRSSSAFSPLGSRCPSVAHSFHTWAFPDGTPWTEFYRENGGYLLRFPDLADFRVSADGLEVTGFPVPGVSESTSQHLYLNQVLPLVLSKLGKLVFHASAVEVPGGAVAFAAESGRGKSTLAASFAVNGFRFLTDDGLVLEPVADGYQVQPSHPSIRLWEDSEEVADRAGGRDRTCRVLHFQVPLPGGRGNRVLRSTSAIAADVFPRRRQR